MVIPLLTFVLAFILTINTKNIYKSTAQISTGFTITDQVKLSEEKFNLYEINVKFSNLLETLNSPMVMSLLSYRLAIHDLKSKRPFREMKESEKEDSNRLITLSSRNLYFLADSLNYKLANMEMLSLYSDEDKTLLNLISNFNYDINSLKKLVNVSRVRYTDYVSVTCFSENPELSAYIVNTLCEEFMRYYKFLKTQRSSQSVHTFSQLVTQKKRELEEKSEALKSFKSSSRVFDINLESSSKMERIRELEVILEEEKMELRGLEYSLSSLNSRINKKSNSNNSILNDNTNSDIIKIRNQINDLNEKYILGGSKDENIKEEIINLRRELQEVIEKSSSEINSLTGSKEDLYTKKEEIEVEIKVAKQNIKEIDVTLKSLRNTFGTYASKEANIAALQREVQVASEEYLNAQEKYNESLDVLQATTGTISQVLYGQPSIEPEPSKRILIVGLSGFTSLILCIFSIVFLDFIDNSIKTPSNFSKSIPFTLLAVVNHLKLKKGESFKNYFQNEKNHIINNNFLESIRKLRYNIEASNKNIILFVSNNPGEGKTTIIQTLSFLFSKSKKKVLIIDTNFLNNTLTKEYSATPLLEKILKKKIITVNKQSISMTIINGVDILGCEGGNYSPSEIITNQNFLKIIDDFKQNYDYILMEAASLNERSDAKELLNFVEGVVAIYSAKSTLKQTDKETINFLSSLDKKLIGAVLNNVENENIEL